LKEQDNNNIDVGESNNRRRVVNDEDNFDYQTHSNEEKINVVFGFTWVVFMWMESELQTCLVPLIFTDLNEWICT